MGLFNRRAKGAEDSNDTTASSIPTEPKEKVKWSRRPANTAFKQQRLKAWQPILTPATVLPTFFLIGLVFLPLGGVLLYGSNKVKEFTINYTACDSLTAGSTFAPMPSSLWNYKVGTTEPIAAPQWSFVSSDVNATNIGLNRVCTIEFDLPVSLTKPVFLYYKLTNYYQNHRRYVKSISQTQLKGTASSFSDLQNGDCKPVAVEGTLPIYPCGLIANSVFNDTFTAPILLASATTAAQRYNFTDIGIAWPGEAAKYGKTAYNSSTCVPPPYWTTRYPNGYTPTGPTMIPVLSLDEHFQVWMRTAGLPTFRKLFFRNDDEDLNFGRYSMQIRMNYPVAPFSGTKSIVISTVSFIGGKNPFLGIAYLVVGAICTFLGMALTARHLIRPRKLGDMRYLSWNTPGKEK